MRLSPRLGRALAENFEAEHGILQHRPPLEQMILLQDNSDFPVRAANALAVQKNISLGRLN